MPRVSPLNLDMLQKTLRQQGGVIARRQAAACDMTEKALRHRTRAGGPWQTLLPGVYLDGRTGNLTTEQRAAAAFLYAGRALAITGPAALAWHRVPGRHSDIVDVLVPIRNGRSDAGFARLHRTVLEPTFYHQVGAVRYATVERSIADSARQLTDIADVRAVVAAAVQRGLVLIWQLEAELRAGPVRGSGLLRRALTEVAAGARSAAEVDLMTLIKQSKLPEPLYNPRLYVGDEFLASPDAWWPRFGVAVEVDSKAWHLSPADWERTLERHARMTAQGILVLHFPPARLRTAKRDVIDEIWSALQRSPGPLAHVKTVQLAA